MNNSPNQETLLVVDDIPANISVLTNFLENVGFEVLIAKNGKRAIQKAEYAHPDLILMDVMMPEMNGFDACRILKSQESTQEIPIIFMTLLTDTVDKIKGFELGAADYITKPIQQEEVLARVKSHLKICKLQHQLQKSEQKFRAIFDQTHQLIGTMTIDGILLEANKTALQLLDDVQKDTVIGQPFWEAPWWSHSKALQTQLKAAIKEAASGKFIQFEVTHPNPITGKLVYIDFSIRALKDKSGNVILLIPEWRDITEHKQAEENKIRFIQASQKFVPHQFLNLLGRESVIDVQLGDQIAKEMTILFADIRNFTHLSEQMSPKDNFNFIIAFLCQMEPAIVQHNGFIDKYIGDAIMALFPNTNDALQAAIDMLKRLVSYNLTRGRPCRPVLNIGIGLNTGPLILGAVGTHNRMDSTVIADAVNLASRVEQLTKIYHTPLLITEYTYQKLVAPSQYHIRVIDATKVKGRSEEITIYEVFDADQAESITLKNETLSTFKQGFVLYHCDEFMDAQVFFENVLQVNENDHVARIYLENCQKILNVIEKHKILLIDDTPRVIELLLSGFDELDIYVAKDGKKGLEIAELKHPHLILLDIMMPGMDGFETCKCLKENSNTQDIPVIFMTALSEAADKVKGLALGAADYITKPFNKKEVLLRVKTHLNLYRLQKQHELEIHDLRLKEKVKALIKLM